MKGIDLEKIAERTIANKIGKEGLPDLFILYFKSWNQETEEGKITYKTWQIPDKEIKNILLNDCKMYEKIGIGKPLNKYLENIGISKEYENETNAFMKAIIFKYVEKIKYDNKEKFKKEHNMTEEHYQKLQYDFTEEEHIPSIYDFNIPFRDGEF